jgi:hypothetical protein
MPEPQQMPLTPASTPAHTLEQHVELDVHVPPGVVQLVHFMLPGLQ